MNKYEIFLIAPACTESAFTVHTGMRIYPNFNHGLNVHMLEEHYFRPRHYETSHRQTVLIHRLSTPYLTALS